MPALHAPTSTEHSLLLLRQFECLLQRDSLLSDLGDKHAAAFQAYAADLEAVQRQYEKHKVAPPLSRNAPPVAGAIQWARHLLHRIEAPMGRFQRREALMAARDSKRVIRTYNRLAQALLEFEGLWHQAWLRSVDNAKAQLQATLLTQHPETGGLGWAGLGWAGLGWVTGRLRSLPRQLCAAANCTAVAAAQSLLLLPYPCHHPLSHPLCLLACPHLPPPSCPLPPLQARCLSTLIMACCS